jgi:hypothetical protein
MSHEENPREGGAGYPEEEPAEVAGDEATPQREGGQSGRGGEAGGGDDDETATGNPHAAGG